VYVLKYPSIPISFQGRVTGNKDGVKIDGSGLLFSGKNSYDNKD
jgi:hypothetical protein